VSAYVLDPPARPSVAVAGSDQRFPVRRIFCVGRNYADHVKEMGGDPKADPPIFFTKPADAVADSGAEIAYPPKTEALHHEAELVVALKAGGADIPAARALDCVHGYAAGCDLTRRDLQAAAKAGGKPWDEAKGFDASAPIGAIRPGAETPEGRITLTVNERTRQDGALADMIWSVPEIIAALSQSFALKPGDLIMTGSPEGVGPLAPGDQVAVEVSGLAPLRFSIR